MKKSLENPRIGHRFFWLLKSESSSWPGLIRVLAILEAFCRGLEPNLEALGRSTAMIRKMSEIADKVKERKFATTKVMILFNVFSLSSLGLYEVKGYSLLLQ